MSRGFVKEDDQEEIPMVPPRAYLPDGVNNYVTQNGMDELLAERQKLVNEKELLVNNNENEKRIANNHINARLALLNKRIDTAMVVDIDEQAPDEVRFGATVTLKRKGTNNSRTFRIVGVDEADIPNNKISFISPIAQALMNKKAGDKVVLNQSGKEIEFEILNIGY